jgi:hypothetical protein
MKKILFILLFVGTIGYAQTENSLLQPKKNYTEVKVNAISIALGAIDLEFERTLTENSSIGLAFVSKFFEYDGMTFFDYDSSITGFYRYFLGKKYAQGLFFEGYGMFHSERQFRGGIENNLLIGLGTGYKHVFENGIILQGNFGIGADISGNSKGKPRGRGGISIGYRF